MSEIECFRTICDMPEGFFEEMRQRMDADQAKPHRTDFVLNPDTGDILAVSKYGPVSPQAISPETAKLADMAQRLHETIQAPAPEVSEFAVVDITFSTLLPTRRNARMHYEPTRKGWPSLGWRAFTASTKRSTRAVSSITGRTIKMPTDKINEFYPSTYHGGPRVLIPRLVPRELCRAIYRMPQVPELTD